MAMDTLLLNRETGLGLGIGDDYALYRGELDPRFRLVAHDLDSLMQQGGTPGDINASIFQYREVAGLERLMSHPGALNLYYRHIRDLIDTLYNRQTLDPVIDELLARYEAPSTIDDMKQFIEDRSEAVLAQIPSELTIDCTSISVFS